MRQTFGLIGVMGLAAVLLTPSTSLAQQSVSFSFGGFVPKSEDARVDSRGRSDDGVDRWDGASVHDWQGRYGDYLSAKVARVFPELAQATLDRDRPA